MTIFSQTTIIKLFTDPSEVGALPAGCPADGHLFPEKNPKLRKFVKSIYALKDTVHFRRSVQPWRPVRDVLLASERIGGARRVLAGWRLGCHRRRVADADL